VKGTNKRTNRSFEAGTIVELRIVVRRKSRHFWFIISQVGDCEEILIHDHFIAFPSAGFFRLLTNLA
jgi:hypothetical protein